MSNNDLKPNPYYAFIELICADLVISSEPNNHIMGLTHKQAGEGVSMEISLEIFDESALMIESHILAGYTDFKFRYGYEKKSGYCSPTYKAQLSTYNITFSPTGTSLTLELLPLGVLTNQQGKSEAFKKHIHEIVKILIERNGWEVGYIEPCMPVYEDLTKGKNPDNIKTFIRNNETFTQFIDKLKLYSVSQKTGESNYKFWVETADDKNIKPKAFYKPVSYQGKSTVKHFDYAIGLPDENVISLELEIDDALKGLIGSGKVIARTQDKFTNEYNEVEVSKDNQTRVTSGSKTVFESHQAMYIGGSAYSPDEVDAISKHMFYAASNSIYKATLTVRGCFDVKPWDIVSLALMTPQGHTHHSSGIYTVLTKTDTIDMGQFTSVLELIRNGTSQGQGTSGDTSKDINTMNPNNTQGVVAPKGNAILSNVQEQQVVNNSRLPKQIDGKNIWVIHSSEHIGVPHSTNGQYPAQGFNNIYFPAYVANSIPCKETVQSIDSILKEGQKIDPQPANFQVGDILIYKRKQYNMTKFIGGIYLGAGYIITVTEKDGVTTMKWDDYVKNGDEFAYLRRLTIDEESHKRTCQRAGCPK